MAEASDARGILDQNLIDAGCGEALIAAGKKKESLALLAQHRSHLLDCCHAAQKQIDCLEDLVYRMQREKTT